MPHALWTRATQLARGCAPLDPAPAYLHAADAGISLSMALQRNRAFALHAVAVARFLVGGLAALGLGMFENHQSREGERQRFLGEAEDARRHALGEFGAKIHLVVEALYTTQLAEEAWREESQYIDPRDADMIATETTLPFALRLVDSAPDGGVSLRVPALRRAERLYADFLVKRDAAMRAGSGQALCVALMSRLRTRGAREAVASLSIAIRALENGIPAELAEPVKPDMPRARLASHSDAAGDGAVAFMAMAPAGLPASHVALDRIEEIDSLVRRVSDEIDNAYREIRHELTDDSLSLWSEGPHARSDRGADRDPRNVGLRLERRASDDAAATVRAAARDA
jgi:hypothetical protein